MQNYAQIENIDFIFRNWEIWEFNEPKVIGFHDFFLTFFQAFVWYEIINTFQIK